MVPHKPVEVAVMVAVPLKAASQFITPVLGSIVPAAGGDTEYTMEVLLCFSDFSKYPGKVSPSWRGIEKTDPIYDFTYSNNLWHYHIGLPEYIKSKYNNYLTSDMILHFQWKNNINHIRILDITWHYKANGLFWLPKSNYLD